MAFSEIVISDFDELIKKLYSYDEGYVFRGLRSSDWPLSSTLARSMELVKECKRPYQQVESVVTDMLKSKLHHYIHKDEIPKSSFGWLSIAQHHGCPTRLIDFTTLPLVALYFASRGLSINDSSDFAIWVVNYRDTNRICDELSDSLKIDL